MKQIPKVHPKPGLGSGRHPAKLAASFFCTISTCLAFSAFGATKPAGIWPVNQPFIKSCRTNGNTITIVAQVSPKSGQVMLQSRAGSPKAWKPLAVKQPRAGVSQLVFQVAKQKVTGPFRLVAHQPTSPVSFFSGRSSFSSLKAGFNRSSPGTGGMDPAAVGLTTAGSSTTSAGAVVESDIWKIEGNRLYFFNQYRGLQVIDISNPDEAALLGTLDLPAVGEQLYLLHQSHVLLLAQNWASDNLGRESQAILVDVSSGTPAVLTNLFFSGYIQESRMVGSAVYLACEAFRQNGDQNDWGTQVTSLDFSTLAAPVVRSSLWFNGYADTIAATDTFLFLALENTFNWYQSEVHCIDISSPNGQMLERGTILPAGYVADKFRINFSGNVLTLISETLGDTNSVGGTVLETFSLADPNLPVALGSLALAQGEFLTAARFDGTRAYLSTVLYTDPLWVVDLANPSQPQIAGQLAIPGSQNLIYPLGDRLVAIGESGSNDWRTAVSLFDVTDPANPALLSKVALGQTFSWSDANYDDHAASILSAQGLILVPYSGDATNGFVSGVQLVDLSPNALALRGTIPQAQARRAAFINNRILSISPSQFLSTDATDRDRPLIRKQLVLAWPADNVFLAGDYLLEISSSVFNQSAPAVHVTLASSPNQLLSQYALTNLPLLGVTVQSNRLYLLQGEMAFYYPWLFNGGDPSTTNSTPLVLTVLNVDASQLPDVEMTSQLQLTASNYPGSNLKALWPKPGVLVWAGQSQQIWFGQFMGATGRPTGVSLGTGRPTAPRSRTLSHSGITSGSGAKPPPTGEDKSAAIPMMWPWYWGNGALQLLAFDVSDDNAPSLLSNLTVATNGWGNSDTACTTNGLIFLSHSSQTYRGMMHIGTGLTPTLPTGLLTVTNSQPTTVSVQSWTESYFLDVVDYADPIVPVVRDPAPLSGPLAGISRNGEVVYCTSLQSQSDVLQALGYDGVQTYLIASLPFGTNWPHPFVISGESVTVAKLLGPTESTSSLETWTLTDAGRFGKLGALVVPLPVYDLHQYGDLLAAQSGGLIQLCDATAPASLSLLGSSNSAGWLWPNLSAGDGAVDRGLWLPLGDYGVLKVALSQTR